VPEKNVSAQIQTPESALVQHLINSGQFDPPPGNTQKTNSFTNPFLPLTQAETQEMAHEVERNLQEQQRSMQGSSIISARVSDKPVAAVVRQVSQSVGNQASPQTPVPPQTQSQIQSASLEFESPPGIGSAKGGR